MDPAAQQLYWDERYRSGGAIWGLAAARVAVEAAGLFTAYRAVSVLVPGCGYGRHCLSLARCGFKVYGFDISQEAITQAQRHCADEIAAGRIHLVRADWLAYTPPATVDALFAYNVLHFFTAEALRAQAVARIGRWLNPGALALLSVFSSADPACPEHLSQSGGAAETKPGRGTVYFSKAQLARELMPAFSQVEVSEITEAENHGAGPHTHRLLLANAFALY